MDQILPIIPYDIINFQQTCNILIDYLSIYLDFRREHNGHCACCSILFMFYVFAFVIM